MNDHALTRPGLVGAVLAAICCAAPLLAVGLPLAGLGAWLTGTGLAILLPMLGIVAWGVHRRWVKAVGDDAKTHKEGVANTH